MNPSCRTVNQIKTNTKNSEIFYMGMGGTSGGKKKKKSNTSSDNDNNDNNNNIF